MLQRLAGKLPVKRGEGFVTSLMFFYIFGVMTLYYILKPLRSALFLTTFPASHLAYAYLLTALFAGTLAALMFRITRHLSAIRMATAVNVGIIATLLLFRWAIGKPLVWLPYAYFVYVQMVSALSTAIFWLLAGYLYDSRQSRRIFPLLGLGAILGAMTGSVVPGFLSSHLSVQSMVLLCAVVCSLLIIISRVAWRYRRPDAERAAGRGFMEDEAGAGDILRTVFGSRHLSLMVLSVLLAIIASQLVDWQLNDAAKRAYQELPKAEQSRAIGQLFAQVNFATNVLGAIVQLALTSMIVRSFGIGAAILFLPGGLLISSIGVLAYPGLATTIFALGVNNVFEHSLYRVGRELLYLPLPPDARKKVKVFIDVFADKCGRGVAGVIILAIAGSISGALALRSTALTVIVLAALCVLLSIWLRRSYQDVLREHLSRREVDLAGIGRFVEDPGAVRMLIEALGGPGERQILYALPLLQSIRGVDFSRHLLPLLGHRSPFVREEAARTLSALPGDHSHEAETLLADTSGRVRSAAIEYLCSREPGDAARRVSALLKSGGTDIRITAARWVAENPQVPFQPPAALLEELVDGSGPDPAGGRAAAAFLATRLPAPQCISFLRARLEDPDPAVVQAAARAANLAGHAELVFDLARLLRSRKHRAAARESLVAYGPRIIGTLGDLLTDQACHPEIRREIPWVLGRIPTASSSEILLARLEDPDRYIRYRSAKALNRMREQNPNLPPPRPVIVARIFAETKAFYEALAISRSLAEVAGTDSSALLLKSLRERMDQNLELIFRLLGLQYEMRDIYSAYSALKGSRSARRTSAIEFLDSLLRQDLRAVVLPLVEEPSTERLIELAVRTFGIRTGTREEALEAILIQNDEWLVACALHEIGSRHVAKQLTRCRQFMSDSRPLVRETAAWAARQLES